jgi:hypothetical protein
VIYVRSILAGIAVVLTAAVILSFVALLVPTIRYGPMAGTWNLFNPLSALVRWPLAWFFATIIFGAGFYWELQNVSNQDQRNFSRLQFGGKGQAASARSNSPSAASRVCGGRLGGEIFHVISRRRRGR